MDTPGALGPLWGKEAEAVGGRHRAPAGLPQLRSPIHNARALQGSVTLLDTGRNGILYMSLGCTTRSSKFQMLHSILP